MSTPLLRGTTFAGLRVESVLGRGGMGVVYRAVDPALGRPVALKLITPEMAEDPGFRRRFLREPRLAASLDHPHVVPIYDAGEHDGQLYLAMRLVEGGDLKAAFAQGLENGRLLRILDQIASALDAAHRRGLVHRDVKPANILLDEDDQAYLTDFGITKELSADSTGGGQLVGTLEYLAPEQIRGEPVDGRADEYSLACVLHEGLSGAPPFRRRTEAETLWGHMQETPPSIGVPAVDDVLRRGLAKERDGRYATCAELVAAARGALGVGGRPDVPTRHRRIRRTAAIGGAVAVVVAVAVSAIALSRDHDEPAPSNASGIASFDGATGRFASLTEAPSPPSNVAVGEGAIWALNTEERTVTKIDPGTHKVVRRFSIGGIPSDIAVGAGAVWVGRGGGAFVNATVAISRVDPRTTRVTHTTRLRTHRGDGEGWPSGGFPGIAVGGGGVWAVDPAGSISRLDPREGRVVATVRADASTIAAGDAGVWFAGHNDEVSRIDPRTNRVGQTIRVGANALRGIAVGGGAVWAAGEHEGLVWRIDPGSHPVTRTIDIGPGVSYLAFGDRALWAANYIDGRISRVDPRTNRVTATERVGAAQALAAGSGAAWVSVAGAPRDGSLPASACGDVESGGVRPDVVIASDLLLQGPTSAGQREMAEAIRVVLRRHEYRAGRFAVGYASCDTSTAQSGTWEVRRCAANANGYAAADRLVAVIGPYNSDCAAVMLPILNRAAGGPIPLISPANTAPGLTRPVSMSAKWGGYRDEPRVFYPTGVRNYMRLLGGDDLAGVGDAIVARRLSCRSAYLLDDGGGAQDVLVTGSFRRVAGRLGIRIAGAAHFDPAARGYATIARRTARAHPGCVVVGGDVYEGVGPVLKALRAALGRDVPLLTGGWGVVPISDLRRLAGAAAEGVYVAANEPVTPLTHLTGPARDIARELGTGKPRPFVLETAQAAEIVLAAIARSDGTRASVLEAMRHTRVSDGVLGSFSFDRNGDITPARVAVLRIDGRSHEGAALDALYAGTAVDSIVEVPPGLGG
jgi:ABC-type branched-subunit amino acid transport system substrate-binding protein/predicted Ser/Thr protein kinase